MQKNCPVSRKDNLVVQELDNEVLIYDLNNNKVFCLNHTSALIWQACDGEKTIPEISKYVSKKLNLLANEDLIWFALDQLKKEKLIDSELPNWFEGVSRREIIKKVGFATMIALPLVASIAAPLATQAQSINCMVCISFQMGGDCGLCANIVGSCFDNSNCGMGQANAGQTCANCQTAVGTCAGGPNTCSWEQV